MGSNHQDAPELDSQSLPMIPAGPPCAVVVGVCQQFITWKLSRTRNKTRSGNLTEAIQCFH